MSKDRPDFASYLRYMIKSLFKRKGERVIVSSTGEKYVDVNSLPWIIFSLIYLITYFILRSKYPLSIYAIFLAVLIYLLLCPLRYFFTDFERSSEEDKLKPVKKYTIIQRLLILLEVLILVTVVAISIIFETEQEAYADTVIALDKNTSTTMESYYIASQFMKEHYQDATLISYGLELHGSLDSERIYNFRFKGCEGGLLHREQAYACEIAINTKRHQMGILTQEYDEYEGERRGLKHPPIEIDVQQIVHLIETKTGESIEQIAASDTSDVYILSHLWTRDYQSNVDPGCDTWVVRIDSEKILNRYFVADLAKEKVVEVYN